MSKHRRLLAYSELDERRKTWRVRYRDRGGNRVTVASGIPDTEKGRKLVKALVKSTQARLDKNLLGSPESTASVEETFERFLIDPDKNFTPRTIEGMRGNLKSLWPRVATMDDFVPSEPDNPGLIERWRNDMLAGKGYSITKRCAKGTVHGRMRDAKSFLRWCQAKRIITWDPFAGLKNPQPKSTATFLTEDEIEAIETACEEPRFQRFLVIFRLGWSCGLREGEIFNARAEDLRYMPDDSGQLHLRGTKSVGNAKQRIVPINAETMELLGSKRSGPLVPAIRYPDRGWTIGGLVCQWKGVKKAARITRKLPFHSTRHTYAKRYLQGGGQEGDLAKILGHEGTKMIHEVYGHWTISTLTERSKNVIAGIKLAGHRRDKLVILGGISGTRLEQTGTEIGEKG